MKKLVLASLLFLGIFSVNSCARQGTPSGGPKDETPPVLVRSFPDTLAVNVDPNIKEIEFYFDEYIQLKDYKNNVIISPPFTRNPIVSPQTNADKVIKIKLQEPLLENTTYNLNFGDAIQDYNENNKLSNFSFVFSTGNYIDSLAVKGTVYPGYDFELPKKVLVGLYEANENFNDSVILNSKPYYISRINEKGEYNLKYLRPGQYKIIAFQDEVENNKFDLGKEKIAFQNEIVNLNTNQQVDLKLFKPKPKYRLISSEQKGYGQLLFKTEGATNNIEIIPIDRSFTTAKVDVHLEKDSVNFWFNPKKEEFKNRAERLKFEVKHLNQIDTVTVLYTQPVNEYESNFKAINESKLSPTTNFKIAASAPIKSINKSLIYVYKDTVQIPFDVKLDTIDQQILHFKFDKNYSENFEINAFPNAIIDQFDVPNDTLVYQLSTGSREDFGNLKLKINNLDDSPTILQLIKKNQKYEVIEEVRGTLREFYFANLTPGEYYLRLLVDKNQNGVWDSGDVMMQTQPEPSYIYPSKIVIRALWDSDETWVIGADSDKIILDPNLSTTEESNSNIK